MQERAQKLGRKLGYGMSGHVICGRTLEEAQARANSFEEYGKIQRYNKSAMAALGACLVGTPDMIIERINAYEQAGLDLLLLHFNPMIEGFDLFVEKILPHVKHTQGAPRRAAPYHTAAE
jgi:FMNH2-dependent dimethyl sulfone monooxygenase